MAIIITSLALAGLAAGYFVVFAQSTKPSAGYLIVACFCLLLSATYVWKAYTGVNHKNHQSSPEDAGRGRVMELVETPRWCVPDR